MKKREHLSTAGGNVLDAATMENSWRFLKKLKIELPHDLAIPLVICRKEMKSLSKRYTSPLCSLVLLTINKIGNNLCPSTGEWMKKM